jgi:hypothetical protein
MKPDHVVVLVCIALLVIMSYARSPENVLFDDEFVEFDRALKSIRNVFRKKHSKRERNVLQAASAPILNIPTAKVQTFGTPSKNLPLTTTIAPTKAITRTKKTKATTVSKSEVSNTKSGGCSGWCIFGVIGGTTSMILLSVILIAGCVAICVACKRNVRKYISNQLY